MTDLGSSINLSLPCILSLTEHSRGHELVAVFSTDEVRGLQEDGGTVVPGHRLPLLFRSECTLNCRGDSCLIGLVVRAEVLRMVVWHGLLRERAGLDLLSATAGRSFAIGRAMFKRGDRTYGLAVDNARHLEWELLHHLSEGLLETLAFG